jgi:hypothetical protein
MATKTFAKVLVPLDAEPIETQVLSVPTTLTLGSGWLWQLGERLAKQYGCCAFRDQTSLFKPEPLDLSVYETSYCTQHVNPTFDKVGEVARCGPGYGSLHSPNIRTDLCFYISQLDTGPTCGIAYSAPIWVVSQKAVDQALHHPEALDTSLP